MINFFAIKMISIPKLLAAVAAVLAGATLLMAQFDSGQISGFVRDQTGAVVPGAAAVVSREAPPPVGSLLMLVTRILSESDGDRVSNMVARRPPAASRPGRRRSPGRELRPRAGRW